MAQAKQKKEDVRDGEDIGTTVPEQRSQVVPVGSMDVDPSTGAAIRVGYPETSDEDEIGAFILWLQEKAEESNGDSMSILADALRRANTAESLAEALREKKTVNGKDYVGIPFLATGFAIHEGKYEDEEIPFFASIDAVNPDNPDGFVVNCGGDRVLVHIRTLDRFQSFPVPMVITAKETRKKRTVLSIEILQQKPQ